MSYDYDSYGRIRETAAGAVRTTFAYNAMDQRIGKRTTYPVGSMHDLIFTYTPSGKRETLRFRQLDAQGEVSGDQTTRYSYDKLGRIKTIEKDRNPVATFRYHPKTLLLVEKVLGNGNRLVYEYNPSQQLEVVATYDRAGNHLQSLDYDWNIRGQLVNRELLPAVGEQN